MTTTMMKSIRYRFFPSKTAQYYLLSLIPSSSSYSTSVDSPFIVDYIVRSLGCSRDKAISASKKLLHIKSPEKPDAVLEFFRRHGLSQTQISSAFLRLPAILVSDVETILLPKLKLFQNLGASGKELGDLVVSCSSCFANSLHRRLEPNINFLRNILGNDKKVRIALKRCPWILKQDTDNILSRNVELLRQRGLGPSQISTLVLKSPVILILKPDLLNSACKTVEELGIVVPKEDSSRSDYVDALQIAAHLSKERISKIMEIFTSFGFSKSDFLLLFRRSPTVMRLKDETLKKKLKFFVNTMKCDPPALLQNASQLGLSLDRRLEPRYRWLRLLQTNGLVSTEVNFARAFIMPRENFLEEYVHNLSYEVGATTNWSYLED